MTNSQIAKILRTYADLLEIAGGNPFKVRAYRNGARIIEELPQPISQLLAQGYELHQLPGIGADLSRHIEEIVETGSFTKLRELQRQFPLSLLELRKVGGLGPKRIALLYERLGIDSLEGLAKALEEGRLQEVPGFGKRLIETIRQHLAQLPERKPHLKWSEANQIAQELVAYLKQVDPLYIEVAGSFRRKKEVVGDLDILIVPGQQDPMAHFLAYPHIDEVLLTGPTRSSIILQGGIQVDLRVVSEESFGSALQYFTGSKAHNIAIRRLAQEQGLKVNEYGVFEGERKVAGAREDEVYEALGLCYIEPELREDRGEIEACLNHQLPNLITLEAIQGDLHMHTTSSDGTASISQMAQAARERGYRYIAITDHSPRLGGPSPQELLRQLDEIARLNRELEGITILSGIEVDILPDGSLDMDPAILQRLDVVIGAIHSHFRLPRELQTKRLLRAMEEPSLTILAHPTGRIIDKRPPMELDLEAIFTQAARLGVAMEINGQPDRLDLPDIQIKMAKELGVSFAINSDAHSPTSLHFITYAINQARRGWCEPQDTINSYNLPQLLDFFRRRR
ncbi:MAG: DNA polymerase/3'-5' exonuclease PolX [Nitratiruptor sp.]|nr:DNA polymerase/3'-5' exonuclease PolX [Nitratiruptor sp.]NPA83640.1 DNA polymerase/3'-5' exonuclease PolX [Campylobacterota bacterium]